jgi:hypothetical protein
LRLTMLMMTMVHTSMKYGSEIWEADNIESLEKYNSIM